MFTGPRVWPVARCPSSGPARPTAGPAILDLWIKMRKGFSGNHRDIGVAIGHDHEEPALIAGIAEPHLPDLPKLISHGFVDMNYPALFPLVVNDLQFQFHNIPHCLKYRSTKLPISTWGPMISTSEWPAIIILRSASFSSAFS